MFRRLLFLISVLLWAGCDDPAQPSLDDPEADACAGDAPRCDGDIVQTCVFGTWADTLNCTPDQQCVDGQCAAVECVPDCGELSCGRDGCGGVCGQCPNVDCIDEVCVRCVPIDCLERCGDDGCGGNCGGCNDNLACNDRGRCVSPADGCGDGICAADEDCASCEDDCGCGDGEQCALDQGACVPLCTPRCDDRICGDDGCGGVCGECEGGDFCRADGLCGDQLIVDASGAQQRRGPIELGRLVVTEPSVVSLRLSHPGLDDCPEQALIALSQGDVQLGRAEGLHANRCAELTLALAPGEYDLHIVVGLAHVEYILTTQFSPTADVVDASGVYHRLTEDGDDTVILRVAEPVVFAAILGQPSADVCPYAATIEVVQGDRSLGTAVSQRNAAGCSRLLAHLAPGEYRLRFFSDEAPAFFVDRYAVQIAMIPIGPDRLGETAVVGRPGASAGQSDVITIQLQRPSIVRSQLRGPLGRCIAHRHAGENDTCADVVNQQAHPAGELTLTFNAQSELPPYVLHLDIEPIPSGDAFLPGPAMLRPTQDEGLVFVQLDVPARVEFAVEGAGALCEVGLTRIEFDGYDATDRIVRDGSCTWSVELAPGVHGYSYVDTLHARLTPMDRRITVTPLGE